MTVETTTVTTQTQNVIGQNFLITTVEQTVNAFCDCCDNRASGTRDSLQNRGWSLGSNAQFCPECNY